jgi:hypothetical protein
MSERIQQLDRRYKDRRGFIIRVIAYDWDRQWVIFMQDGYEHECFCPLERFKEKYERVL